MALDTTNDKPTKARGAKKPAAAKTAAKTPAKGNGSAPSLKPLADTLKSVLAGNLQARVASEIVTGEVAEVATLFNQVLERFSDSEHRKQIAAQEIDQALDALIALVREGDLSRWNTTTEDPQLAPLLEGFGKVIETLRTFVREINEAALRLSSSANQVLAASTQHETSSTEQAAAIHETTATMEELKHASAQIAENAGAVARVAEETLGAARAGRGAIAEFI
jgi:hypothetical protein